MKRQPRNHNRSALDVAPKIREYLIPMHFVTTHDAPAPAGGMAARIPWLEEIRSDQFLADLHPEIS